MSAALLAIDATLAGEPVAPDHAELAELALILAADAPRPSPEFARELDDRVARRFARPHPKLGVLRPRPRWRLAQLASAGLVAVVAVVVALSSLGTFSGGQSGGQRGLGSGAPAIPAAKLAPDSRPVRASSSASAASSGVTSASSTPALGSASASGPTGAVGASSAASAAGGPPSLPSVGRRQVVQSAQLQLAAAPARVEDVAQQVFDVIGAEKGIVNSSNVTATSNANGYANFQLTVPNANLTSTMTALSQLHGARVLSRSDSSSDITRQVGGAGEKLADVRALRRSLLAQLAAATNVQQVAKLKGQLRSAEASIASDLSTLRGLHRQVDDSKIQLTIQAVPPAAKVVSGGSFTVSRALHDAGRVLVVTAGVALIALAALVPVAMIGALLAWIGFAVRRRRREQALDLL